MLYIVTTSRILHNAFHRRCNATSVDHFCTFARYIYRAVDGSGEQHVAPLVLFVLSRSQHNRPAPNQYPRMPCVKRQSSDTEAQLLWLVLQQAASINFKLRSELTENQSVRGQQDTVRWSLHDIAIAIAGREMSASGFRDFRHLRGVFVIDSFKTFFW